MLIEYKIKNYKTFKNKAILSMIADSDIDEQDYSLLIENIKDLNIKGLSTAVIYGPNGVGKTNLINSLKLLKKIILNRSIKFENDLNLENGISSFPNLTLKEKQDLEFEISFTNNKNFYNYILKIDVGIFGEYNLIPKVTYEKLELNNKLIYERVFNKIVKLSKDFLLEDLVDKKQILRVLERKLNNFNLLLFEGSLLFKDGILENFLDWFESKLLILPPFNYSPKLNFKNETDYKINLDTSLNKILKSIFHNSRNIVYYSDKDLKDELMSVIELKDQNKVLMVESNKFESDGTIKLIKLIPLIITVLQKGATVFIDELDASIHSTLVMSLLKVFHDDRINKNHAQLIITTHNPIYMAPRYLRQDEINFLDYNEFNEVELYSLSDFDDIEPKENYINSYLQNQYGALQEFDLNNIFMEILSNDIQEKGKEAS